MSIQIMTFDRGLVFLLPFRYNRINRTYYGGRNFILDQLLCQLNQKQLEIVTSTEGFIRVIAGAGSRKKPERYLTDLPFLVNEIGILPGNIPLCYFYKQSC